MTGRNDNSKGKKFDSVFFWDTARRFLDHELPRIRKKSRHTISSYRTSLNICIGFLEEVKGIRRERVCFHDLDRENLKDYLVWMADVKAWSPKTCNLRLTAVKALLSYASEECMDITPVFVSSRTVHGLDIPGSEIRYFEDCQMKALLNAPGKEKRSERRNKMMLILGYDAAMRVGELTGLKVCDLHLDAEIPYIRILGKGGKYRSVPIMKRTVGHLRGYLREFHGNIPDPVSPLFYAVTHGMRHGLSDDCIQKVLKEYAEKCRKEGVPMPEDIYFHMLRKTRAMSLYQEGCPLSYIQQMLGHENISTTSGFYAFVTLDTLAKALERTNPEGGNAEKNWKDKKISEALYRL
jgi:site-specific recombinase XerD